MSSIADAGFLFPLEICVILVLCIPVQPTLQISELHEEYIFFLSQVLGSVASLACDVQQPCSKLMPKAGQVFGAPAQRLRQYATVSSSSHGIKEIRTPALPPALPKVQTAAQEQDAHPFSESFNMMTSPDIPNFVSWKEDAKCPSGVVIKPSKSKRYINTVSLTHGMLFSTQ